MNFDFALYVSRAYFNQNPKFDAAFDWNTFLS